ncbi:myb/SANT-like DNA-binding domain-containing protein 4 [Saccostrea echinata]|uniref:myb/SANT-like DNA-binding domain-containing protein 4 n=1 Tax=Saccostrea echinata TaxID=191078 RepID=UPI002A825150|nr:myb/SANT-like DNA-binding domain-containing protein 4 [Saccostrea echinata]
MKESQRSQKKRSQNWGDDEEVTLIEEVKLRSDALFGLMRGSGAKGKLKEIREKEWQMIADKLNSQFDSKRRSWEEVKKKYYNLKSRSKEKLDGLKHPKTGGGPPLPPLTQGEETFLRLADGEPNLCGVPGGIDTDAPHTSELLADMADTESTAENSQQVKSTSTENPCTSKSLEFSSSSLQGNESRKRKIDELEEANLILDNKRLEEEILKIKEEREVLALKKDILVLKKQKLVLDIQTSYPCFLDEM